MFTMELFGPRQTILVTCRGKAEVLGMEQEKDNAIAIAWHMPLSFEPMMYAIAVAKQRFSYKLIKESKVFCVNFMPNKMLDEVVFCGTHSGAHTDKLIDAGLHSEDCDKIHCQKLIDALGWLECEVVEEIEVGDHVMFTAKVLASNLQKEAKRPFHITGDKFTTTTD